MFIFYSRFNDSDNSVIVVLHIQKTAGTLFENFLVSNLSPCNCNISSFKNKYGNKLSEINHCNCNRLNRPLESWLFSRQTFGWTCGVHADFTALFVSGCVDNVLDSIESI